MLQRAQLKTLQKRVSEARRFIQVVNGPRQVGKSTMLKQLTEDWGEAHHFVSADGVANADTSWLIQQWETARIKLSDNEAEEFLLIVDEVQKIENWSEYVKQLWDEDSHNNLNLKVILCGSSRLQLQTGLTESLAGRFESIYLPHWSLGEMEEAFGYGPEQYAWFGGYPGPAELIGDEERWKDYIRNSLIETTISKDILLLNRIHKPALLRKVFELGCHYSGKILSYTKMLGQLQDAGNTTTLAHYLELLHTAGLLQGLEKYAGQKVRSRSSSPKFQVHNTALLSAQDAITFEEVRQDPVKWGHVVESAVGAHLLNAAIRENFQVFYWRQQGAEVDFVLQRGTKTVALEVKSVSAKATSGMRIFQEKFKPHKVLMTGRDGLPWEEFLRLNPKELF